MAFLSLEEGGLPEHVHRLYQNALRRARGGRPLWLAPLV